MKTDYKSSILLPNTDFSMRAGLPKQEPKILEDWKDKNLFSKNR